MSEPDAQGNYPGLLQAQVDEVAPSNALTIHGNAAPLWEALAKATAAFKPILKSRENPYFKSKYADLADVLEATRPALAANGLVLVQPVARAGEEWVLTTILAHSSGARLEMTAVIGRGAGDWQKLGSAMTYCRRYVVSGLLGVASEADDDGNAAVDNEPSPAQRRYEQKAQSKPPAVQPKQAQQSAPKSEPAGDSSPKQETPSDDAPAADNGAKGTPETRAKMIGLLKELGIVGPAVADWAKGVLGKVPSEITLEVDLLALVADLEKRKAATS